ncbi:hypothetical protein VST63_14925 [Mycolicibacterium sp. 050232]|uniref:hypothetical protein n=1 Tax=Mycolicibacterium sp. 050232 TaxID=3113982 RepID=UPI002E2B8876|nr:hypothetical protein [Mycolicibacterium sp. 050232]MED5813651.1 hypothetical protein [Mycolicibacterium sp. 050232]
MTALIPPPVDLSSLRPAEPLPRRRRLIPRSRRGKTAVAAGLVVLLVAGFLGAAYETAPGGALWGVAKTVFPEHTQDVALTAVVDDLKRAQDILGSGQQPSADQLTDARTALNQAKQGLDYVSPSPQRTSLQNLYLQLTQQLLQYTPDSVQQLVALPAPPEAPPAASPVPDATLTSGAAPMWGYTGTGDDDFIPPPPGVPAEPVAGWPQPVDPPLTPNLGYLGYYDPSWGQLYGYNSNDWYNYDLGGYNRYGYDFLGFDRWGYDRWGYDRWGYDRWGYNWAGYNWAGYDRHGWDRSGWNEWGQRRDHPGDPRRHDWYDRHHPYRLYYQWKFHVHNPVYRRTQWNRAHGFNPDRYRDWNRNRDWHNPRNRDWARLPNPVIKVDIRVSAPVVNLNASLTQFISTDKATRSSRTLMKNLADKSARDFTKDLAPRPTILTGPPSVSALKDRPAKPAERKEISVAPPALTDSAPKTLPSKVSPEFTEPKVPPAPAYTPPTVDKPRGKQESRPDDVAQGTDPDRSAEMPDRSAGQMPDRSKAGGPERARDPQADPRPEGPSNPEATAPGDPKPERPSDREATLPRDDSTPRRDNPVREAPVQEAPVQEAPAQEAPARQAPVREEPPRQRTAPEAPVQTPEAPRRRSAPEPPAQAPTPEAPVWQEPAREAPPQREAPAREAPIQQAPVREAPPQREAPARQRPERQAPQERQAPRSEQGPRQAPEQPKSKGPKCSSFPMC